MDISIFNANYLQTYKFKNFYFTRILENYNKIYNKIIIYLLIINIIKLL